MNRRSLLAVAALSVPPLSGGCLSDLGTTLSNTSSGCQDPGLSNELPYEMRDAGELKDLWDGAVLVTDLDDIDRLDERVLGAEDETWIRETDFSADVVVGVQVGSSGQSSDIEILGVERDGETLSVYSCIEHRGMTDDWVAYTRLLRVAHDGEPPTAVVLTHREGGDESVYE